ncbi:RluA family pseudouridine synthase [Variovorax sp. PCZ-1]|uniref:RluA family pseudouridine synthase n=1 Tax=Variovorax sp. PCZ-1 TaxID=2835533 RepID=UPI0032DE589C
MSSGTAAPIAAHESGHLSAEDELDDGLELASPSPDAAHQTQEHRFTTGHAHHGERLDRVLAQLLPDSSRSFLQQLIDSGDVLIGGVSASKASAKLKAGQELIVRQRPLPQDTAFHPDAAVAKALNVVFEDPHLMIINKAPGLVVHPAAGNWSGTLLNGLLAHHECHTLLPRAGIVHRLDKDTSGLMVVARTREAMDALIRMIAAREVKRQYLAMAHYPWQGMSPRQVDAPIGRDPRNRQRMAVVDLAQYPGKEATTDFELLSNSEHSAQYLRREDAHKASKTSTDEISADAFCLLRCNLHTGRTHQIRVHAAYVHHPLIADAIYGGRPAGGLERQGLHAERLAFEHPITGEEMAFEAGLPPDMRSACEVLGLGYN